MSLGAQKALYIAADMGNDSDPEKVVDFALEKLGGLDYLVLNHIGPSPFSTWKGDVEHVKWLMKVMLHLHALLAYKKEGTALMSVCVCVCASKGQFLQLCSDGLESFGLPRAK